MPSTRSSPSTPRNENNSPEEQVYHIASNNDPVYQSSMPDNNVAISALRTTMPVPEASIAQTSTIRHWKSPTASSRIDSCSEPSCDLQQQPTESPLYPPLTCEELGYRPLNLAEALTYLDRVKLQLQERPEDYKEFLDIMRDSKSDDVNVSTVVKRITYLFREHPLLIDGFNAFLPSGYRIDSDIERQDDTTYDTAAISEARSMPAHSPDSSRHSIYPTYDDTLKIQSQNGQDFYGSRQESMQFSCAISFINKIKTRFSDDENRYSRFMSILKTHILYGSPIQEVHTQVQDLFSDADDILEEFERFLPRNLRQGSSELTEQTMSPSDASLVHDISISEKREESDKKRLILSSDIPKNTKRIKTGHGMDEDHSNAFRTGILFDDLLEFTITMEESEFFDRVEEHIGNKATYDAFLKLLNTFSQRIIDRNTLVDRAESFLGGDEALFAWFKEYIGYEDAERGACASLTNRPDASSKSCGPSYRLVPKSWRNQRCSGRDPLCWEVLNDEYVSHPTWASEDSGFVSSKKSQFEEMLHRIEDERHEYDMTIEANLNTIALLEEIEEQLSNLSTTDKEHVCLLPDLGGAPKTIYHRAIRKAFGNEKVPEIIELLHNKPVQMVPILLKRLKQKNEDWKREQQERNKVWRDLELKNYYKALDYRSVSFRFNDKKATSRKTLVNEIQALQLEQSQVDDNVFSLWRPNPQYTFFFTDREIFKDISSLLFVFLERQQTYNAEECRRMRTFVESFLRQIFVAKEDHVARNRRDSADTMYDRVNLSVPESNVKTGKIEDEERPKHETRINFLGNDAIYCFFRLYQIAYERLLKMKMLDTEYQKDPRKAKRENKAELQLDVKNKRYHAVPMDFSRGYYNALLQLINGLFAGVTDPPVFEECSRYIFGTHSYIIFTIDKLIASIARQDPECQSLSIQLLGDSEEVFESEDNDGYDEYINSYSDWSSATIGVDQKDLTKTFLDRNMQRVVCELKDDTYYMYSGLRYKICRETYHLFKAIGTCDAFARQSCGGSKHNRTTSKWKRWLESDVGWRRGVQNVFETEKQARELLQNGQP
ncbi:Transcriptional regulatory protein sin3 [Apophysomyces ossiformis]|uniref:Transcriptional regulatory protein sin3 n=1 Tax=Apophysomyces ossiformis TaxID=679940 RepID=A0A8H7BSP7_9FUNG|nr:Transcriptional regulatory protein sin3 [Apophysomyces ossiformis]